MMERRPDDPQSEPKPAPDPESETGYTQDEEDEVRKRLEDLGYVE